MKLVHNFEEIRKGSESDGSYQSVWMAHWTRTDIYAGARHDLNQVQIAPSVSGSSKQIEEIGTSRTLEIMKQSVRGGNLKNKQVSFQSLPVNGSWVGKQVVEFGRSALSSSYMGCHFAHANDQFLSGDKKQSETEPYHCSMRPPDFLGTSSIKNHTISGKISTPYRKLASLKDPSISSNRSSLSRGDHLPLQNFPGFRMLQFSSHDSSPEQTELEKFHDGYSFMRKLPPLVPRVETHRIGADVDFVGGSSGFFSRFSPNTRNMLITKNTDVIFGKEGVVKNVGVSSNIDVNAYLSSSSPFVHRGQQGVKIQSLGSSSDTEGNKYHEDSKDSEGNLKNASSAETDAMDMDAFTEGCQTSGVNESSFKKALNSKTMQFSGDKSGTGTGNTYSNSELPDINVELSAANNTTEGTVPSSSKTQSLEMDMLVAYPARTNNSISGPCLNMLPKTDPTGRWAKRLKSGALDTQGYGTQSFDLEDGSRNKMKRRSDTFTSELLGGNPKEKLTEPDKAKAFETNDVTSSKVGRQRGKDLLLSQSWIQRWLRNQAGSPKKQSEALVLCEPQSSKLALDDLHKKQFPSIAAMALMGKAMNGFEPCELQNRGAFVVWN